MNNLTDDKEPAVLENFPRGVGKIDGALDTVAKTELFRQAHGRLVHRKHPASAANFFHNIAAIMRFDLFLHRRHHIRRAQVYFLARRRAAGNEIRAHKIIWRLAPALTPIMYRLV